MHFKQKFISVESGDVREQMVDSWTERLPEILQGWQHCNIWKVDETGQFFRALPNRSLTEAASQICTGGKKSKDRQTCLFFTNASGGTERPFIIGKSANPRCFRGIQDSRLLPCQYFSHPKAWMNSGILMEILSKLNRGLSAGGREA